MDQDENRWFDRIAGSDPGPPQAGPAGVRHREVPSNPSPPANKLKARVRGPFSSWTKMRTVGPTGLPGAIRGCHRRAPQGRGAGKFRPIPSFPSRAGYPARIRRASLIQRAKRRSGCLVITSSLPRTVQQVLLQRVNTGSLPGTGLVRRGVSIGHNVAFFGRADVRTDFVWRYGWARPGSRLNSKSSGGCRCSEYGRDGGLLG